MADFDDKNKYLKTTDDDDESGSGSGSGQGGQGGQGGIVEFHDFLPTGDIKLPPEEERRKLAEHKDKNSALVEKQKELRDSRQERKENRNLGNQYGNNQTNQSQYAKHPIIGNATEFDGIDPQLNSDPNLNEALTNSDKKEELTYQYQYQLKNELVNQSKFVPPRPSPNG